MSDDDSSDSCVLSLSCSVSSFANSESSGDSELEGELGTVEPYQFEPSGISSNLLGAIHLLSRTTARTMATPRTMTGLATQTGKKSWEPSFLNMLAY